MDGVQKCLMTIPGNDPSLLVHPNEGYTWTFMARCIGASVPDHINKALYFFYRVMSDIESRSMTRYVLPTYHLELKYDRETHKHVTRIVERRRGGGGAGAAAAAAAAAPPFLPPPADGAGGGAAGAGAGAGAVGGAGYRASSFFAPRLDTEEIESHPPLTMRMGFTGAFFTTAADGKQRHELICCLFVTPLRNFDLPTYITESFLAKPRPGCQDFKTKHAEWVELSFTWHVLLQYEAFQNLRLDPGLGNPANYMRDPSGRLGADALLCMLNMPIKVHEIILALHPTAQQVQTMGLPALSLDLPNDENLGEFLGYLREYLDSNAASRGDFERHIEIYNAAKEVKFFCPFVAIVVILTTSPTKQTKTGGEERDAGLAEESRRLAAAGAAD